MAKLTDWLTAFTGMTVTSFPSPPNALYCNLNMHVTWQQHCALSFRCSQSQLVEGHHLSSSLQDPVAGTISDPQSADLRDKYYCQYWTWNPDRTTLQKCEGNLVSELWEGRLTLSLGISWILTSSVTVPTTTAILLSRPGIFILRIWKWERRWDLKWLKSCLTQHWTTQPTASILPV